MRRQEGDQDEEGCGRLKFVSKVPIVLDASSSANGWISSGNLFERLNEAWRVLQTAGDGGSIDLTMPTLCQPLFEAIPRLREAKPHVQDAAGALNGVREELGSLVEFLSDAALATLLEYAEQCGEIILSRETISGGDSMQKTRLALVMWDPNWFTTAILGEFFQPAKWRDTLLRSVRMRREDVVNSLRDILINNERAQADDNMLELLPEVLEQMRLCIPIGSQREEWFPAFLNSAEKLPGFHEVDRSSQREESAASETLLKYLHVDARDAKYGSARTCGRLLLLKDRFGKGVTRHTELKTIFPCGSFSRFQARVLEAFPNPAEEEGSASSAQPEACETFLSRNFVRLSWRGDDGKLCYFHSLMLHNDRGIEFAWIAWLWASSNKVDVFMDGQREGDVATVMDQMIAWMEEASTIKRRKPALKVERLRPSAFFADKAALLDDGADSFLKPYEMESCQVFLESAIGGLGTRIDETAQRLQQQYQEIQETVKGAQSIAEKNTSILERVETMVESGVHANHVIPCTLLLLPQVMARKLRDHFAKGGKDDDDDEHPVSKWRQLKRAISARTSLCSKPLYLYFFCPVSGKIMRSNGGRGFKFFMPREWFSAASPYLRPISAIQNFSIFAVGTALGLTALAVSICRALELPGKFGMNDRFAGDVGLAATGASLIERLEELPEEASEEEKELRQQIEKPDDGSFDPANLVLQNPEAVGGDKFGRVIEMLKKLGATAELGKLLKRSLRPALANLF
eukprot:scaffold59_cov162-Pinguiococcus_pyrenoidosus.AAC.1